MCRKLEPINYTFPRNVTQDYECTTETDFNISGGKMENTGDSQRKLKSLYIKSFIPKHNKVHVKAMIISYHNTSTAVGRFNYIQYILIKKDLNMFLYGENIFFTYKCKEQVRSQTGLKYNNHDECGMSLRWFKNLPTHFLTFLPSKVATNFPALKSKLGLATYF